MSSSVMNAIRVHQYGNTDVLKHERIELPEPKDNEILIKVRYATVTPFDWKMRKGLLHRVFPKSFPYIPGGSFSGVVEKVGAQVTNFEVGQAVFGSSMYGGYAEYTLSTEEHLLPMPNGLTYESAATITAGAAPAWKALFSEGNLQPNQKVLIHAAAGGVGQFAVQLAKWRGAKVVGTASTHNVEFVKSLGADEVIDYNKTAFEDVVDEFDLVVDAVGGNTLEQSWKIVKKSGTLVSLTQPLSAERAKEIGIQVHFNTRQATMDNLKTIAHLLADGQITSEIEHVYPWYEVKEAHEKSETGHARGRILLEINSN
ncbi:zinc-binding dehydrogenase [Paenibacillus sp. HJL G12]|uniref:Zinc-binding dehydrogenase n=1 Tax=Paenibacillus dendrobii TaxID=2691084 RepID=A0A7X3IPK0_9BACL|nr:NADP-dependent oxidoreductase [Paenibacillus dendrobii]MWV47395.1 zinc-binding dehydrogenase [Paenibacillus dendrobii]